MATVTSIRPRKPKRWELKSVSGWRAPSLNYRPDPYFAAQYEANRTLAYKAWLLGRELPHVNNASHGEGTFRAWQAWINKRMTDVLRDRITLQRTTLDQQAEDACRRIRDALVWRGFGAYVYPSSHPRAVEVVEDCFNCDDGSGQLMGEQCCICNGYGIWVATHYLDAPCMMRSYSYFTDGHRFAYVGTTRTRGYTAQERQPIQIILLPGHVPTADEIESILDDALGEQTELSFAA
jgi:hypothetical protein